MMDFILSALPWVVFGIIIAVVLTNFSKRNRSRNTTESQNDFEDTNVVKEKENTEEDYMSIGMSIGMCFGVAIGSAFMEVFGTSAITYGICFGMLGGMVVGMNINKK